MSTDSATRRSEQGLAAITIAVATTLVAVVDGVHLLLTVIVLACLAGAAELVRRSRRARAAERRQRLVVEVCEAMVGELRAGQPLLRSLEHCVEVWPDMGTVLAAGRLGADVPSSLRRLARLPGAEGLRQVAAAWQVSQESGAGLATVLAQVARTARERESTRHLVRGELASAQATARLVAVLPLGSLAMSAGIGGDPWHFLLGTAVGLACLGAGCACAFAGLRLDRPDRCQRAARLMPVTSPAVLVAASAAAVAASLLVSGGVAASRLPAASGTTTTGAPATRDDRPVLRWLVTAAVALGVLVFAGLRLGPPAAAIAATATWWLCGRLEPPSVRRRRQALEASVPHAVDLMAACLAAGLSPTAAVEQIRSAVDEPLAAELGGLSARLRLGVDPATVWRDLAAHPQLGGLGRTVSRAVESGASVAEAMQRHADDLRGRSRAQVESKARAVGVKAAIPLGGCLLPAFVLVGVVPLVAGSVAFLLR